MITCDLPNDIISIQVKRELNNNHSFSISCIGRVSAGVGSIVNFSGDCGDLAGTIQGIRYDKARNISTLSGSDNISYQLSKERIDITIDQSTQSNLGIILQYIDNKLHAPPVPCYGPGVYSGSKLQFMQRVCNSFGLYYIADNSGINSYITKSNINNISEDLTNRQNSDSLAGHINKIYLQKTVNLPAYSEMTIQNSTSEEQTTEYLQNPNAEETGFSKTAFIDPWTKTLINIQIPVNYTVWNKAIEIGNKKQVQIVQMGDSAANPAWILELWDNDPGTPQAPTAANKLAEIATTQGISSLWQSNGQEVARYARIGRWFPVAGSNPVKDYPHYDGVRCKILAWDQVTNGGPQNWNTEKTSQLEGIPDYNIISETMFPDLTQFNSAGIGERLLDIDRTNPENSGTIPFLKPVGLMDTFMGININRIDNINWNLSPGVFNTQIQGEE